MTEPVDLNAPDGHLNPVVAASYDRDHDSPEGRVAIERAVGVLRDLAGDGPAVEFAIGTGRVAVPLAAAGVDVSGMDISAPMLEQLAAKPGAQSIEAVLGDMTTTVLRDDASLAYLVFNTIMNLRSQELQVACFRNAAAHLRPGGRFLIETIVPAIRTLPPGQTIRPFDVSPEHLGFDEYVDPVNQISVSHHYFIDGDRVRTGSAAFRYVWPSELDLMAQLAGLELESRWADWQGAPFTAESPSHISIWRKPS